MPTIDPEDISLCRALAKKLHAGQTRPFTGADYFEDHLRPVAELCRDLVDVDFNAETRCVAYLHDAIEDCDGINEAALCREGVPAVVARNVATISHKKHEPYALYLRRVCSVATPAGLYVKLLDIHHNRQSLFDLGYPDEHRQRGDKYALAIILVRAELLRRGCDPFAWIPTGHTRLLRPA